MAIKFGVNLATQKTNISSSLFHCVPRMARSAASQPLLLAGPPPCGTVTKTPACKAKAAPRRSESKDTVTMNIGHNTFFPKNTKLRAGR